MPSSTTRARAAYDADTLGVVQVRGKPLAQGAKVAQAFCDIVSPRVFACGVAGESHRVLH